MEFQRLLSCSRVHHLPVANASLCHRVESLVLTLLPAPVFGLHGCYSCPNERALVCCRQSHPAFGAEVKQDCDWMAVHVLHEHLMASGVGQLGVASSCMYVQVSGLQSIDCRPLVVILLNITCHLLRGSSWSLSACHFSCPCTTFIFCSHVGGPASTVRCDTRSCGSAR